VINPYELCIIMPARNASEFIAEAILSLDRDLDGIAELVLVDDASIDGTAEIASQLKLEHLHLHIVSANGEGISKARNLGLVHSNQETDYILFLDSDDLNPKGKIPRQLAVLRSNPEIAAIFGKVCYFDKSNPHTLEPAYDARTETIRIIQLGAGILRRRTFSITGVFDETFSQGEDCDLYFRIHELGLQIVYEDEIGVYYRRHTNNITNDRPAVRSGFIRAIYKSAIRRTRNPNLITITTAKLYKAEP
jgi:glycosyltransferase involved in cell wall biosynthesis